MSFKNQRWHSFPGAGCFLNYDFTLSESCDFLTLEHSLRKSESSGDTSSNPCIQMCTIIHTQANAHIHTHSYMHAHSLDHHVSVPAHPSGKQSRVNAEGNLEWVESRGYFVCEKSPGPTGFRRCVWQSLPQLSSILPPFSWEASTERKLSAFCLIYLTSNSNLSSLSMAKTTLQQWEGREKGRVHPGFRNFQLSFFYYCWLWNPKEVGPFGWVD